MNTITRRRTWALALICVLSVATMGLFYRFGPWETPSRAASKLLNDEVAPDRASGTDGLIAGWVQKLKQNPQDGDGWTSLGEAFMQKGRESLDVRYYGRAQTAFEKALALRSTNVSAIVGMASVKGSRHEFDQSIDWANKAVALDPGNVGAFGVLGDAALEMGDYEKAYERYQKMIDARPDLSSYSRGAYLLYLTGDTRKAIWLMRKAIAAGAPYAENTAWCRAQLALMLWGTGALEPAEQTLNEALERTPQNPHLLLAMGKVKTSRRDYQAAIDAYKRAIAVAPQHETVAALGDLYRLLGQEQEAQKQFLLIEQIHQLNKAQGVRGDMQIARFYADHDSHLSEAVKMAEEEFKLRPNVFAADALAWSYYKNARYKDARKTIAKALSQRTPDANILFHAGMIYAKEGDHQTAQKYLYEALSLNPTFHPVFAPAAVDTLKELGAGKKS
jgi:tetratricopeptide (TPR) repeat protein